ncbi:hypothetical protein [Planomicrobium sp. CPCC 101079]|uniref:hypothetical protein n=1 Tax=Planomicrobium sp. CPCC 101079 TaxID=2599618 RepID=UPI0011B6624C|nr:hypothetical protein [Planomicrobium sp. CPCC 101079]TWT04598.1 hypothetical protein FQV28_08320 [Planomicrobium sp. CPCC 101079]
MIDLTKDGFLHQQVKDMLHAKTGSREVRFRYHLLDIEDNFITELTTVESGEVKQSAFSDIKRTANFTVREASYLQESYATWGDVGAKKWSEL